MPLFFWSDLFLEARAEIQKYFRSFFGASENFKKSFRNWLTFSKKKSKWTISFPFEYNVWFQYSISINFYTLDIFCKEILWQFHKKTQLLPLHQRDQNLVLEWPHFSCTSFAHFSGQSLWLKLKSFTTSKTDRHLLNQNFCQIISVIIKTPAF